MTDRLQQLLDEFRAHDCGDARLTTCRSRRKGMARVVCLGCQRSWEFPRKVEDTSLCPSDFECGLVEGLRWTGRDRFRTDDRPWEIERLKDPFSAGVDIRCPT